MRIVVDARKAADYGIGTYIRQLGAACARLAPDDEFVFLGRREGGPAGPTNGETHRWAGTNVSWQENDSANYGVKELVTVSWQARQLGADLFHAPHYVFPLLLPCPGIVTVHDCIHLRFPRQLPHPAASLYAKVMTRRAVRSAARVLTVSDATKADLVELVAADPAKIDVIPHGCDPFFLEDPDAEDTAAVTRGHGIERPFLLSVSNIKPHKNLKRLIEAFAQLHGQYDDLDLVIAGGRLEDHPELAATASELGIERRIHSLGFVSKQDLRALYDRAHVFVFPSLYEGFGLPLLEAMACGTPVVASRSSAIPEVVGRAGLLVNPYRVDAIAEAVRSLLENDALRDALGATGRDRAQRFDWEASAHRVLEIYREVGGT